MGAMRIARTVTGRSTDRDLHRRLSRHLRRGDRARHAQAEDASRPRPASCRRSPRTCSSSTTARPSRWRSCKQRAHELAAVLVEPVQCGGPTSSRSSSCASCARFTESTASSSIFDEVVDRLPRAPARRPGPVRHPGRPRDVRQGRRRRLLDRRDRRQAPVHGRARRRTLAVRRRLDSDGRRHLLRRHVRPPPARARRRRRPC